MRFAIVATVSENDIPTEYVPIVSDDLAAAVISRLRDAWLSDDQPGLAEMEEMVIAAFNAEEKAVRAATVHLGRDHE